MWVSMAGAVDSRSLSTLSKDISSSRKKLLSHRILSRARSILSFSINADSFYSFPAQTAIISKTHLAFASAKTSKVESLEPDDDFDEWVDDDLDEFDEIDDGSDDEGLPFEEMNKWLRNKPRGFGEGKIYDTSVEDKLMDEIERSRLAQAVNLQKLKNSKSSQNDQEKKSIVAKDASCQVGARVRIVGLPKKKNIHRDLKLAFNGVPNIISISPAVEGNKKTRDPICKGFAIVDFKSDLDAQKFVATYSHQSILFGRVEKQIICNIVNTSQISSSGSDENPLLSSSRPRPTRAVGLRALQGRDKFPSSDQKSPTVSGSLERHAGTTGLENHATSSPVGTTDLAAPFEKKKSTAVSKKKIPKTKKPKTPALSNQGSALRLKVKERAVLTGVLSKYGGQPAENSH